MDLNLELLELKKSKIRNAGIGCFAKTFIPMGTLLGPYKGRYLTRKERNRIRNGLYIWKLTEDRYVDAKHFKKDNPLRYVNGAKTKLQEEKINCEVKFLGRRPSEWKVYYITNRTILPGEELIVSYGDYYFK